MTLAAAQPNHHPVVLEGISWEFYERMLAEIGDHQHVRLTYDEGRLEIMSPSNWHEKVKKIIGRLIEAYSDEVGIPAEGHGSTTFKREDLLKGLEADECYYIRNIAAVIGKEEVDLTLDPPPDLAVEVDISTPSVARQPIYAAMGVPEIWRYDGHQVISLHRGANGKYESSVRSLAFPTFPMEVVSRLVEIGLAKGQAEAVRRLREWARGGEAP